MKNIKSYVCRKANELVKEGYTRSEAFKTAWALAKSNTAFSPSKEEKTVITLSEKVKEYRELQVLIEQLEEKKEAIKKDLVEEMETQQTEELVIDVFKVRYKTVVSNRFNTTEFKKTHSELYNQYLKESVCKRFTIA